MSATICFSICILFISLTVSALPTPSVVYSAVIYNTQGSPVQCEIGWLNPSNRTLLTDLIKVDENSYHVVNEKHFNMGTWTARGIIQRIRCGKLVLKAPFPNVRGIAQHWEFRVEPDQIVSVGPSTYVDKHAD